MKHPIPYIRHINDVLLAIEGRKDFVVAERQGYTIINYLVNLEDTFPEINVVKNFNHYTYATEQDKLFAIRRECRCIKFSNKTGLVIARPFEKFFNYGEKQETRNLIIDINSPELVVLDKFDGSMIHPIKLDDKIAWCTKMGITATSNQVEEFVRDKPEYYKLVENLINRNYTPIFEWCSKKNQIVVAYQKDLLILTAIRENYNGRYHELHEIQELLTKLDIQIPVVKHLPTNLNFNEWLKFAQQETGKEGYVIRFRTNHQIKIKNDDYLKMHKAKDGLNLEKNIIELLVNELVDDVKPLLTEADLKRINAYETAFWTGLQTTIDNIEQQFIKAKELANNERKTFAIEFVKKQDELLKQVYYQLWDGQNTRDVLIDLIKRNISSQTKVNHVRSLWGYHAWQDFYQTIED